MEKENKVFTVKKLRKALETNSEEVTSAAIFLIVNGQFLYFGEKIRSRGRKRINDLSYGQAVIVP